MTPLSYHGYSFSGSSSQQCGGIPLKLLCLFSSILVHHKKTFRDSRLLKYLINKELLTFSNKIQAKTFTWPDMSFYARTKESNKHAPGRVVIYISVHLVSVYTLTFSNVLLVLALNLIVHKSSYMYCKCSLA